MTPTIGDPIRDALSNAAAEFALPPELVIAIASHESSLDPRAWRHEPEYPYLWDVRANTPFHPLSQIAVQRIPPPTFHGIRGTTDLTEWIGQQSSWGLLQVMGAVARQYGYRGPFPGLAEPSVGAHFGCLHLTKLADRFYPTDGWAGVVAAYNAGTPARQNPLQPNSPFRNEDYVIAVQTALGAPLPSLPPHC